MNNVLDVPDYDAYSSRWRISRSIGIILGLPIILVIILGNSCYGHEQAKQLDPSGVQTVAQPQAAPDFFLMDQNAKVFSPAQLRGKWTILLFGYTHCPDFCPTTLAALNVAYQRLVSDDPKLAINTQVVFVSVDPFRDPPPVLADFIRHFNHQFIGVTGPPPQLQRLVQPLGEQYDYADPVTGNLLGDITKRPQQNYAVDHGAGFYVFDDQARMVARVLPPHNPKRIVYVYKFIRKRYE